MQDTYYDTDTGLHYPMLRQPGNTFASPRYVCKKQPSSYALLVIV